MTFPPYDEENVVFGNDNPIYKSLVNLIASFSHKVYQVSNQEFPLDLEPFSALF